MGKGGGRPKDDEAWKHAEPLEGRRRWKCNYCELVFAGGASRIKAHINKGEGIRPCPKFPQSNNYGSHKANSNNDLEDNHGLENNTQGQVQDDAKDQKRIRTTGSISVSDWEIDDLQVIRCVSESLSSRDIVFRSQLSYLTQKEFTTLVKPETCLDSSVIDAFVEILTDAERNKTKPSNWYLPVTFSTKAALTCDLHHDFKDFVVRQKIRENYMSAPKYPEKVFIPVHIGPQLHGHFYLYIIHLKNKEIEIWDSLPTYVGEGERAAITKALLLAMEELFREERTFTDMKTNKRDDIPSQPNGSDCGIFVIKFMEQSDYYVKINHSFKFDGKKEREDLALKLLKSDLNQEMQNLYDKARRYCAQVEKQDGNKRLRVDSSERVNSYDGLPKVLTGKNFQSYVQQIWEWIMDDHVSAIAVWGMGGSGKTTLAYHIHDKLLEEANRDIKVIWVTVSQKSIFKLQEVIARSIKLDISDEYEVKRIAPKLFQAFREMKRCVLILDDVWDHFSLEEVGFPMSDNRIKLIMTTRIWEVCQGMGCEENTLVVKSLYVEDSWALFKKIMGFHEGLPSDVRGIARNVAYECNGLPLAIVRIATSMKGKKGAGEWSHMLECLRNLGNGQYEIDKWVLPVLRSSYDFLNNKLQRFFLYYALTANEYLDDDDVNCLIRRFVYESMHERKKLRVQYIEGYTLLDKLKNHSMLDVRRNDDDDDDDDNVWKIHKFLRVLAFGIAEYSGGIMVDAYKNLTEIPSGDRWKGDLQKVFLTGNWIQTIPDGTCPNCSQLSTLLLDGNYKLNYISDDFFNNMLALKTLDLSRTAIERLPESVSSLKCLVALLLSGCSKLSYVPSLSELKRLISLDLSNTAITEAPMGLESLVNLRWLNLLSTNELVISESLLSKLTNLECLELGSAKKLTDATIRCIQGLKKLEVIVARFHDVSDFNNFVSFMAEHDVIRCYCLSVRYHSRGGTYRDFCMKRITLEYMNWGNGKAILPGDVKELFIYHCCQGRIGDRCLCSVLSYAAYNNNNDAHQIERLDMKECDDVEYLCCLRGGCCFCFSSQLVGSLSLFDMPHLKRLVSPADADSLHESTLFSHLTDLRVLGCDSMETLMTPKLLASLKNLRTISVKYCGAMKEMVGEDDSYFFWLQEDDSETQFDDSFFFWLQEDDSETQFDDSFFFWLQEDDSETQSVITLPNLISLTLVGLPELKWVYRGVMLFPSLQTFFALDCHQLDHPRIQISKGCELQLQMGPFGDWSWPE